MGNNQITRIISEIIQQESQVIKWPEKFQNSRTGQFFKPQNDDINLHIFKTDTPRHLYIMSGEGAGKTATVSVMALNKLRRGMSGAIVCVDLPMLVKVWDEVKQWIPWACVIPEHQRYRNPSWKPFGLFEIVFLAETGGYSKVFIGGLGDTYSKWESISINWVILDEARSMPKEDVIKIMTGRIRIPGPTGEPPQLIIASTPTDVGHWMYRYFGPLHDDDALKGFKDISKTIRLSVKANLHNLSDDYLETRGLALTEAEKEVYVHGNWGHLYDDTSFIEDIALWDRLYDSKIPQIRPIKEADGRNFAIAPSILLTVPTTGSEDKKWSEMLVLSLDGGIKHDYFGVVGVSRNPMARQDVVVRLAKQFKPKGTGQNARVDFQEVEQYIRDICDRYNVITIVYDPYQLYMMSENLKRDGIAWLLEFDQGNKRLLADTALYNYMLQKRITYHTQLDGNDFNDLRAHINNAGVKFDRDVRRRRIVKKTPSNKVDLLVCLSMGVFHIARLNI